MNKGDEQLRAEIRWLGEVLGDVLREQAGDEAFDLVEDVRALAKKRREDDAAAEKQLISRIAALGPPELSNLIHALSIFFDLANLAEDRHRVRVLRERDRKRKQRSESLAELADHFSQLKSTPEEMQRVLDRTAIELVFTAHPTEAKRRSIREKVRDLRGHLAERDNAELLPDERSRLERRIEANVIGLWQTDFVRFRRPTVLEELDRSLFFAGNLWRVAPQLYRELRRVLASVHPDHDFKIPPLLRFGTWIGGDRDGNPYVTAQITRQALEALRSEAIHRHIEQARVTRRNLSMSSRKVGVSDELLSAIVRQQTRWPELAQEVAHLSENEPYRRWLRIVQWRLERAAATDLLDEPPDGAYTDGAELADDLDLIRDSLRANHGALIAETHLDDWITQAHVFGLHLQRLDIRQESSWYHDVMDELLRHLGACDDYASLDEDGRQRALRNSMPWRKPMAEDGLSENAREALGLFRLLANVCAASGPGSLGAQIISMTHQPSDMLVVLWLMQRAAAERGLPDDRLPMPIAPLFETIDDLHRGPDVLNAMLRDPVYAEHVRALGDVQIVMIGYSDSTKDGGYVAACWGLHDAQIRIHDAIAEHDVHVRFFHGRGGALGRGGGPAARSILSLPPRTVDVGLRMTEQGEVLAERYDDPEIARRHLEQVCSAALLQAALAPRDQQGAIGRAAHDKVRARFDELATRARTVYRELVDEPGFITYFEQATPISQIEQLPIGSRPARRKQERSLNTLRAIPWVFSWTQCRHLIPAWYGLGSVLMDVIRNEKDGAEDLRRLYADSFFFRAMIDNAVLALSKTDIGIARQHASLVSDDDLRTRIWSRIEEEYDRSREAVLTIIERRQLLADVPWLQRSIEVRNPYVDPLNLIQVELFRRLRKLPDDSPEAQRTAELIRLTIQGIAGGLRTTG